MGQLPQIILKSAHRVAHSTLNIPTPSVLKVHMLFRSMVTVEEAIPAGVLECSCQDSIGTLIGYTKQKISNARMALAEPGNLASLTNSVFLCVLFDSEKENIYCS